MFVQTSVLFDLYQVFLVFILEGVSFFFLFSFFWWGVGKGEEELTCLSLSSIIIMTVTSPHQPACLPDSSHSQPDSASGSSPQNPAPETNSTYTDLPPLVHSPGSLLTPAPTDHIHTPGGAPATHNRVTGSYVSERLPTPWSFNASAGRVAQSLHVGQPIHFPFVPASHSAFTFQSLPDHLLSCLTTPPQPRLTEQNTHHQRSQSFSEIENLPPSSRTSYSTTRPLSQNQTPSQISFNPTHSVLSNLSNYAAPSLFETLERSKPIREPLEEIHYLPEENSSSPEHSYEGEEGSFAQFTHDVEMDVGPSQSNTQKTGNDSSGQWKRKMTEVSFKDHDEFQDRVTIKKKKKRKVVFEFNF